MREFLFKGKQISNDEWVEGYCAGYGLICPHEPEDTYNATGDYCGMTPYVGFVEVDPSTVGQYTGLKDRNRKKIFEGDVVKFKRVNALGYTTNRIGDVRYYSELPIFYIMATTGDAWDWVECEDFEVIGNIHDNPELLKDGK